MIIKNWIFARKDAEVEAGEKVETRTSFTKEELSIAKSVDLTDVAESLGYTVKRIGNYHTLEEMDSIRIYHRRSWYRWSRGNEIGQNGGSQIDFLRVFANMEVKEAVFWLLNFAGYRRDVSFELKRIAPEPKKVMRKPFILPLAASNNNFLYRYLMEERKISKEVIDIFVKAGLIYEERCYHNIVFKGNDKSGNTHFASMRGVFDREGKGFKCDVEGNDKNYGFNVWNEDSHELLVFEAAIDLMSYTDIYRDFYSNKLALGMLADHPLVTFLKEHPQITTIKFCLDNDEQGRNATKKLMQKYKEQGFEVEDCPVPKDFKDYNEWLQSVERDKVKNGRHILQR